MNPNLKILHIEDLPTDAGLVERELKKGGFQFELIVVDNKKDFTRQLKEFSPDIILSDHSLPSFNSIEALGIIKDSGIKIPFILITATVSEEFAVEVMKKGAYDYILKDRLQRLPNAVINAIEKCRFENDRENFLNKIISSEAILKDAEYLAHVGSLQVDLIKNTVIWSEELFRILGYEPNEVEPSLDNFFIRIHPEDMPHVKNLIENARNNLNSVRMNFRIKNKDNSIKYIRSELLIERDEKHKPLRIKGFNQDITEIKIAEESLKKSEANLRTIFNNTDTAYLLLDPKIKIISFNWNINEWAMLEFGIALKEGKNFIHDVLKGRTSKIKDLMSNVLNGENIEYETNYLQQGAQVQVVWYYIKIFPITNDAKKVIGIILSVRDITERKKSEENIRLSEHRFREFFETAPEAILVLDVDKSVFVDYNDNALSLLKCSGEELIKKTLVDISPPLQPDGRKSDEKAMEMIMRTVVGQKSISEWTIRDAHGNLIFCEIRFVMLTNSDRNLVRASIIDITGRKNAEIERNKITADLIQRNKDLEQFAYIVSHNLRAPVANILGASEALNMTGINKEEKNALMNGLNESVKRLDNVIKDLNYILRIKREINETKEKVRFSGLIEDIKISIGNLINQDGIEINYDFSEADHILTLKSYMYSIFYNIIINSIKYRRMDTPCNIKIASRRNKDTIELLFSDNGRGIDLEKKGNQVFGLYKRFHKNIEGKGMGLFMVKTQVETLGGKISIKSEVNKGTEFKIELEA